MKRLIRKALAGAALTVGFAIGGLGCADEDTSMFILGNLALEAPGCEARADSSADVLLSGALDVGIRLNYEATVLVGNQLTPRGDKENLRTETMHVTIGGAEVRLFNDDGSLNSEFTVPATGVISPADGEAAGLGVVNVTLIPAATGLELAEELEGRGAQRTLVAEVITFGDTIGGVEVESAPFTFVIRVCEGCLVDFPPESLSGTGQCSNGLDQAGDLPCRVGQDALVDCRTCLTNPLCAAITN